jgi:hypothetical protein
MKNKVIFKRQEALHSRVKRQTHFRDSMRRPNSTEGRKSSLKEGLRKATRETTSTKRPDSKGRINRNLRRTHKRTSIMHLLLSPTPSNLALSPVKSIWITDLDLTLPKRYQTGLLMTSIQVTLKKNCVLSGKSSDSQENQSKFSWPLGYCFYGYFSN